MSSCTAESKFRPPVATSRPTSIPGEVGSSTNNAGSFALTISAAPAKRRQVSDMPAGAAAGTKVGGDKIHS